MVQLQIDAALQLSLGCVQITRYCWDQPLEVLGSRCPNRLRLDFAVLPRLPNARGHFGEGIEPAHQFEPIGSLLLLPPNEVINVRSDAGRSSSLVCDFDPEAVGTWFDGDLNWTSNRLRGCLDITSPKVLTTLLRLKEEVFEPGFASTDLCALLTAQVAVDLARYCKSIDELKTASGLASWRLKLIDERLAEPTNPATLKELATLCNLSVRQLSRGFRVSRGCSIGMHIARSRLNQAKALLATETTVKAISYSLGFKSPSNFSTAFRRATGESPRQFRQRVT